jgi:hypothetical protein
MLPIPFPLRWIWTVEVYARIADKFQIGGDGERRTLDQASPEAVVRGSAAALTVPFLPSTTMPARCFIGHGPRMVSSAF